jgi:hypothetical protein
MTTIYIYVVLKFRDKLFLTSAKEIKETNYQAICLKHTKECQQNCIPKNKTKHPKRLTVTKASKWHTFDADKNSRTRFYQAEDNR